MHGPLTVKFSYCVTVVVTNYARPLITYEIIAHNYKVTSLNYR